MRTDICLEGTGIPRAADVAQEKEHLDRFGLANLDHALEAAELAAVRAALQRAIAQDREQGVKSQGFAFDPDGRNVHVYNLVNRDEAFRALLTHPIALEFTKHALGKRCLLSNFSANITAPGSGAMGMDVDQRGIHRPWPV